MGWAVPNGSGYAEEIEAQFLDKSAQFGDCQQF
jgi:hypothetical protein